MRIGRESAYAMGGAAGPGGETEGHGDAVARYCRLAGLPRSFLAKIFQKLARSGIVVSSRGAVRGYALARRKREINVKEIFIAIEGPEVFNHCILGSDRCAGANPCALHSRWKQARQRIVDELMERTTLADLAKGDNP